MVAGAHRRGGGESESRILAGGNWGGRQVHATQSPSSIILRILRAQTIRIGAATGPTGSSAIVHRDRSSESFPGDHAARDAAAYEGGIGDRACTGSNQGRNQAGGSAIENIVIDIRGGDAGDRA